MFQASCRGRGERARQNAKPRRSRERLELGLTTEAEQPMEGVRRPPTHTPRAACRTVTRPTVVAMSQSALLYLEKNNM
jgi:hypothetical protein